MKKLFQITHKSGDNKTLYVAAENMRRVASVYDPLKIELIDEKIMIIKNEESECRSDKENKYDQILEFLNGTTPIIGSDQSVIDYVKMLRNNVIDAEVSARGNQSTFESLKKRVKELEFIIQDAIATEKSKYESLPGWIIQANTVGITE